MKLVCITPISQLDGFESSIRNHFDAEFFPKINKDKLIEVLQEGLHEVIFTNPNQQGFILNSEVLEKSKIKIICTASTGLNHIDIEYCKKKSIEVVSITKEYETLRKITSTAELAFCLLLTSVRKVIPANQSVREGRWSWEPFLGRQIKDMKIGIVGHGRLGTMFANYVNCFGADSYVYDPYVDVSSSKRCKSINQLFEVCDAVSLHVHVNEETRHLINKDILKDAKSGIVVVNTSRGEIVNELDMKHAIENGIVSHYACDVLEQEFQQRISSPLFSLPDTKVTFTPHIGGSTSDAQEIAYRRAFELLLQRI